MAYSGFTKRFINKIAFSALIEAYGDFMGRIKTQLIKRATYDIFQQYRERFKENFDENKKVVDEVASMHGKKLRNVIAGYITRLAKIKRE